MTKKDYELIAMVLHDGLRFTQSSRGLPGTMDRAYANGKYDTWHMIAVRLSDELEQNNPKFNRSKFLKACGLEA